MKYCIVDSYHKDKIYINSIISSLNRKRGTEMPEFFLRKIILKVNGFDNILKNRAVTKKISGIMNDFSIVV